MRSRCEKNTSKAQTKHAGRRECEYAILQSRCLGNAGPATSISRRSKQSLRFLWFEPEYSMPRASRRRRTMHCRHKILRSRRHGAAPGCSRSCFASGYMNWITQPFRWAWSAVLSGWKRRRARYCVEEVCELPEPLTSKTIYLVGERGHLWHAVMVCPCGCRATLYLNLLADDTPRWKVTRGSDGAISLSPSVWRQIGCCSHFFVKRGVVEWC